MGFDMVARECRTLHNRKKDTGTTPSTTGTLVETAPFLNEKHLIRDLTEQELAQIKRLDEQTDENSEEDKTILIPDSSIHVIGDWTIFTQMKTEPIKCERTAVI